METWRRDLHRDSPGDELIHFGVKGMRWGIRNEDPSGNSRKSSEADITKSNTTRSKKLKEKLKKQGVDEKDFQRKYGDQSFLQKHKKALIAGAVVVGVVGVVGAGYYLRKKGFPVGEKAQLIQLERNWNKPIDLPKGSILTRVSSVAEKTPRPEGFYCAYLPNDVQRYRAAFSAVGVPGKVGVRGISNEYKALVPVKAPSGRQTVEAIRELAHKDPEFGATVLKRSGAKTLGDIKDIGWQRLAPSFSSDWSMEPDGPVTQKFFQHLKSKGYNAVIDFHNSGTLSEAPLRVIDGTGFHVSSSKILTPRELKSALDFADTDPMFN